MRLSCRAAAETGTSNATLQVYRLYRMVLQSIHKARHRSHTAWSYIRFPRLLYSLHVWTVKCINCHLYSIRHFSDFSHLVLCPNAHIGHKSWIRCLQFPTRVGNARGAHRSLTRSADVAEGPRDAERQVKSCQVLCQLQKNGNQEGLQ